METLTGSYPETLQTLRSLEEMLKCCICSQIACSPCSLGGCEHVFCSSCCTDHLGGSCPVCSIPAHVKDAEVDRQLFHMVNLCQKLRALLTGQDDEEKEDNTLQGDLNTKMCRGHIESNESPKVKRKSAVVMETELSDSSETLIGSQEDRHMARNPPVPSATSEMNVAMETEQGGNGTLQGKHTLLQNDQLRVTRFSEDEDDTEKEQDLICNTRKTRKVNKKLEMEKHKTYCKGKANKKSFAKDSEKSTAGKGVNTRQRQKSSNEPSVTSEANSETKGKRCRKSSTSLESKSPTVSTVIKSGSISKKSRSKASATSPMSRSHTPKSASPTEATSHSPQLEQSITPKSGSRPRSKITSNSMSRSQIVHGSPASLITPRSKFSSVSPMSTPRSRKAAESPVTMTTPTGSNSFGKANSSSPALNKRNAKGETPLHVAAIKNNEEKVSSLLLSGANPNVRDNAGWTPLHEACNHGYTDVARLLLDNGAMINIPGLENDSPLHDAISNNRPDCVQLLVSRGASLTVRNIHGLTPADLAKTEGMKALLETPIVERSDSTTNQPLDTLEYQQPCFMGTSLSREQRIVLQKCAALLQVKLIEDCTPEVTHVITSCNKDGMCPRTVKYLQGVLTGKWILSMEWVETCLELGTKVCEEAFEVQGTSTCPHSQAPYHGRINRKQQLPGLFDGCQFYFHGDFEYPTPEKESLVEILKYGGGGILYREPKLDHLDDQTRTAPYHAQRGGKLEKCGIFIIHDTPTNFQPIRTERMCSMTASWVMDCAAKFKLLDPE